jgi:hypothetical protein
LQRQAVYRLALVSGLVTDAFLGVIRTSVFSARTVTGRRWRGWIEDIVRRVHRGEAGS